MIAYKFLRPEGTSVFTGFAWPLPADRPGAWVEASVEPCRSGIHACRASDLPYWAGQHLYEVELAGEVVEEPTKVIASRGRLRRRIEAWDAGLRDAYTRMCADRGHELARAASPPLEQWEAAIEPSVAEGPAKQNLRLIDDAFVIGFTGWRKNWRRKRNAASNGAKNACGTQFRQFRLWVTQMPANRHC